MTNHITPLEITRKDDRCAEKYMFLRVYDHKNMICSLFDEILNSDKNNFNWCCDQCDDAYTSVWRRG